MNEVLEKNNELVYEVINRCIDCMEIEEICVYGDMPEEITSVYEYTSKKYIQSIYECVGFPLTFIRIDRESQLDEIESIIQNNRYKQDFIIYLKDYKLFKALSEYLNTGSENDESVFLTRGKILLAGKTFDKPKKNNVPDDFKVLAIIHFYNEVDVIGRTIEYLIAQRADIYLVDNWSDDGSYEIAAEKQKKYPDRIFLEHFPESGRTENYEWYNQLERTEEIAKEYSYNWYIHYDADEIRICPWKGCDLRMMLYKVEQLGYNLVENTVIDHKIVSYDEENIFLKDTYFDFGHKTSNFMQTKTWKRNEKFDLKKSGGHIVKIEEPKIYPLKILNRHYPLRSVRQAQKKIYIDREPRFSKEKKERGWHAHYDKFIKGQSFINSKENLILWDDKTFDKYYIQLFTGCGVKIENDGTEYLLDIKEITGKKIIIYGAGKIGKSVYKKIEKVADIVAWVDNNCKQYGMIYGRRILGVIKATELDFDYIIVAVKDKNSQVQIVNTLINFGIIEKKIKCVHFYND